MTLKRPAPQAQKVFILVITPTRGVARLKCYLYPIIVHYKSNSYGNEQNNK